MNGFENNKYAKQLSDYLNNLSEDKRNKEYYQKLIYKANKLRTTKSIELINIFKSIEPLNFEKTCKKIDNLIASGADINFATNGYQITPFMMASLNAHYEFLDYLKEKGADTLKQNVIGQNALMITLIKRTMVYNKEIKIRYLHTVRKLKELKLNACMYTDNLGTTLNDYYLEQFGILDNFYKNNIGRYCDINKTYVQETELSL